jgi:outer membrane receptor protein involved in Fe transport
MFVAPGLESLAQDFRATISGQVTDSGGAVVPGAAITARHIATNGIYKTESGAGGEYALRNLEPGEYVITVEKVGFRKLSREGITLQVAGQATLNLAIEAGEISESVIVREDIAQLQTETAVRGIVVDSTRVLNTPLQGRNMFAIAWSVPGVQIAASVTRLRPFDISGSSSIQINGGRRGFNDVQVDGVTALYQAGQVSFVPSIDSISEFKVVTTPFDSQYGFTTGGVVTSVTRSGSNRWHGGAFEFLQNTLFNANDFNSNRADIRRQRSNINTFGGIFNGPILKDRLFFSYAYEGIRQSIPDVFTTSIPTPEQRAGDFSKSFLPDGQLQKIYDPLTTRPDPARPNQFIRDQFQCDAAGNPLPVGANNIQPAGIPCNKIPPERINPVARAALAFLPAPNAPGNLLGLNNYTNGRDIPRFIGNFNSHTGRLDYNLSEATKIFGRIAFNRLDEFRGYRYGNEADPGGNLPFTRQNYNGVFAVTHTLNTTTVADVRFGVARFTSPQGNALGADFDLARLNFSPRFISQALNHFPVFRFQDYEGLGSNTFRVSPASTAYHLVATVSKLLGAHSIKAGFETRVNRVNERNPGNANGAFMFTPQFTQETPFAAPSRNSGNSIASFLLGYPQSGNIEIRAFPVRQQVSYGGFLQDDWRLTKRLKLNVGLRYEYITGMTDRFDNVNRGFDPNAPLPIQVPDFPGTGNIVYAGVGGEPRGAFDPDANNIMPRLGVAFLLNDRTVMRGGVGIFYAQVWDDPGASGFSQQTAFMSGTQQAGIPDVDIRDPFPDGLIPASRERTNTIGMPSITVFNPQRRIPYVWQYSFEIQRQLPWDMLFSTGAVGSNSRALPLGVAINEISAEHLALGPAELTRQVENPFAGLAPGTQLNGPTVENRQMLRPFPQFGSIFVQGISGGYAEYWAWQSSLQKRFSAGATFTFSYTWSKLLEWINVQNAQDVRIDRLIAENDVPHNVGINGSYELPFGRKRKYLSASSRIVNGILGGWTVNGLVRLQSGMPTTFPANAEPVPGVDPIPANRTIDQWYTPGSFRTLDPLTFRGVSIRYGRLRNPPIRNFDLSAHKRFDITERVSAQLRAEFINAFNTPQFFNGPETNPASANFGKMGGGVRSQTNLPRFVQLALKINF